MKPTLITLLFTLSLFSPSLFAHENIREDVVTRFLRYVKIDSQSSEQKNLPPTSQGQQIFAELLAQELKTLGLQKVRLTKDGFLYALIPANIDSALKVPTFGLIAHLDTSPEVSGNNVNPIIHTNYQGGDIVLPADTSQVIRVKDNPSLLNLIGDDIITADGSTLLGSDDKAGIAAIMTLVDVLMSTPSIKHGDIAIAFTPDEETSVGISHFDIENFFGAKIAYTVDGGELGNITNETWYAHDAKVNVVGIASHTGKAKNAMVNAGIVLNHLISQIPADMRPEHTEGRVGFIHPESASMSVSSAEMNLIIRDFEKQGMENKIHLLRQWVKQTEEQFPQAQISLDVWHNYNNMKEIIDQHPLLIKNATLATQRAGVVPNVTAARWGTDGSSLSFMGLPCPDIFTGGHNFHSKLEFNSRKGLEKTTETLVHLAQIFVENSKE